MRNFYGVGDHISERICARFHIHQTQRVSQLTPQQITGIASFISSPRTAPALPRLPLAKLGFVPPPRVPQLDMKKLRVNKSDPLLGIRLETDLKREMLENIAHQRMIRSYVGQRHAQGLPVRGQNTQNNAQTAKKLNRIERRR